MIKSKKMLGAVMALSLVMSMSISSVASATQDIGYLSKFTVTFSGGEKLTEERVKTISNGDAVVNLSDSSGSAWISATLRNSDGAARGGVDLQCGKRQEFTSTGQAWYYYRLGLRKTNTTGGSSIVINGSWSPDIK